MLAHSQTTPAPGHVQHWNVKTDTCVGCLNKQGEGKLKEVDADELCVECLDEVELDFELVEIKEWTYSEKERAEETKAFNNLPKALKEDAKKFWNTDWKEADPDTLATVNVAELFATEILRVVPGTEFFLKKVEQTKAPKPNTLPLSLGTPTAHQQHDESASRNPEQRSMLYECWVQHGRPYPVNGGDLVRWLSDLQEHRDP